MTQRPDEQSQRPVVLASGSRIRRQILQSAGLSFTVAPADIDERAVRSRVQSQPENPGADVVAVEIAAAKAEHISKTHQGSLVIGCDQTLVFDTEIYDKPKSIEEARATLLRFRDSHHRLYSAATLYQDREKLWSTVQHADLEMRAFSHAFLDDYLARAGESILQSVGCYQLEGQGIQLFEKISGDYFTILGLPLLPLIEELRQRGVLMS